MRSLGLEKRDLIPVSLTMRSASGNQLPIIGAALTRIRLTQSGRETRQMVYISPKATKLYRSLSTCTDLGLVQDDFPRGQSTASIQDKQAKGATKRSLPAEPPNVVSLRRNQPQPDRATAQTEHHLHSGQPHCHTPPRRRTERSWRSTYSRRIRPAHSTSANTRLCR